MKSRSVLDMCIAAVDLASAVVTPLVAAVGLVQAKLGPHRLRRTYKIWDAFGLAPVRFHYYQPVFRPGQLPPDFGRVASQLDGLDMADEAQLELLRSFRYGDELLELPVADPRDGSPRFYYDNPSFGSGDAEILYSMVRHFRPRRIIEVGCGYSTLLIQQARTVNLAEGHATEHVCIEPYEFPWLERVGLSRLVRDRIENVPPALFDSLERNDVLFIDSSHVIRAAGDVCYEILSLLPRLKPGVIVHFHDIHLPFDYPADLITRHRLYWTEQYMLQAFLAFNPAFRTLCAVRYLAHYHAHALDEACPIFASQPGRQPGSYWIQRV